MEEEKAPGQGGQGGVEEDKGKGDKAKKPPVRSRASSSSDSRREKTTRPGSRRGSVTEKTAGLLSEEERMARVAKEAAAKAEAFKARSLQQTLMAQRKTGEKPSQERKGQQQQKQTTISEFCTKKLETGEEKPRDQALVKAAADLTKEHLEAVSQFVEQQRM